MYTKQLKKEVFVIDTLTACTSTIQSGLTIKRIYNSLFGALVSSDGSCDIDHIKYT